MPLTIEQGTNQGGESDLSLDVNEDDAMYGFLVGTIYGSSPT